MQKLIGGDEKSFYADKIIYCSQEEIEAFKKGRRLKSKKVPSTPKTEPAFESKKLKMLSEFDHVLNYRKDPTDERDFQLKSNFQNLLEAEEQLPSRVSYKSQMSPVKDQGELGSCVSFAVAAMKEWQEKREHEAEMAKGKPGRKKVYNYSEAWIYWNCKKIDIWPGEEGTSIRYAMKVLKRIGVPTEKGWPYKDVGDIGEPENWASLVARWALIDSYYRIDTLSELKLALKDGPVPIGIPCFYEMFFVGDDGIIPYPEYPNECYGGHAVCATGYDDNKKLITFKNSWSKDWGQKGYGHISYDYVRDFLWDAWAAVDVSVTTDMLKGTREL